MTRLQSTAPLAIIFALAVSVTAPGLVSAQEQAAQAEEMEEILLTNSDGSGSWSPSAGDYFCDTSEEAKAMHEDPCKECAGNTACTPNKHGFTLYPNYKTCHAVAGCDKPAPAKHPH
eukprot:COSAG05_NODE_2137_length_3497_cov_1.466451_1_plen_116_part_10